MFDLAQALNDIGTPVKGPPCTMGLVIESLDERTRIALLAALADRRKPATEIQHKMNAAGITDVNVGAVRRHRNRECACTQ